MGFEEAIEVIRKGSGKNFDPEIVRVFLGLLEEEFGTELLKA